MINACYRLPITKTVGPISTVKLVGQILKIVAFYWYFADAYETLRCPFFSLFTSYFLLSKRDQQLVFISEYYFGLSDGSYNGASSTIVHCI